MIKNTRMYSYLRKKRNERARFLHYKKCKKMPENEYEQYLKERYKIFLKRYKYDLKTELDFCTPTLFSQKCQWMKLYDQSNLKSSLTDKYEVRKYIKEKIGDKFLVPLISIDGKEVFETTKQIDYNKLPNSFVIKCTHGSHMNIIVKDKGTLSKKDIKNHKKQLNKWLRINYAYWVGLELQYKDIKPRIIVEEYLPFPNNMPVDYKFFCFSGVTKFLSVNENRGTNNYTETYLDLSFNKLPFQVGYYKYNQKVKKPNLFSQMKKIVGQICDCFSFVRVDLYECNGQVYFGELTFSPGAGFDFPNPPEFDCILGDYIEINYSIRNNNYKYRKNEKNL